MAPIKRSAVEEDTVKPINTTTTASRVTRSSARRLNGSSVADSVEPAPADLPKKKKAKTAAKEKGKSAESAEAENAKPKAVAGFPRFLGGLYLEVESSSLVSIFGILYSGFRKFRIGLDEVR
ncbi:hypothetical protein L1049_013481 [Liquidambar formosana]|uniref:Uncharacterized protein n=1 Tax=Liquidambar formosana TaxID=63359 RepID=A0AAP0RNK0_LIQFO